MSDKKVVTFGEIMLRLVPPNNLRIVQARSFDATYAGSEASVAVALASLGVPADFVTRLPPNELGDACIAYLRQFGVGVEKIIRGGDRLGIYFVEMGAAQRPNKVIYDRAFSAFATISAGAFDWEKIFADACWFHWTGITPAVSQGAADTCLDAVKKAKEKGLTISCDLNYRAKLWRWGKTSGEVMGELVKYVDILVANEEDVEKVFGIRAPGVDVAKGELRAEPYEHVSKELMRIFPNLKLVAFSLRTSISASHNKWSGALYDGKDFYIGPTYDIIPIVDRLGAGDAFNAGLIYGLLHFKDDKQRVIDFAVALSCLKHTLYSDLCLIKLEEVETLMKGITTGRIVR